jgi:glycosyltransferase involved in cell wall biosynthesis
MSRNDPLVSICLPIRNGERRVPAVLRSVLRQDYHQLELVISDNASTDATEPICREFARADERVRYHRQPEDIGLLNNFIAAMCLARGSYARWIGDGDSLAGSYVSRCLAAFREDERRILVTTQIAYLDPDGTARTAAYRGTDLSSADPLVRFNEILRLLNRSHLVIDPLYGLMRRAPVAALARHNSYREDQLLAARLALAGPWGHVPQVLAWRRWEPQRGSAVARKLGVPRWQVRLATALLCRDLLRHVRDSDLDPARRRRARAAVARFYLRRHQRVAAGRLRRLTRPAVATPGPPPARLR